MHISREHLEGNGLSTARLVVTSLFENWVERATSPFPAATCHRTERRAGSPPQQASGLFHPIQSVRTRAQGPASQEATNRFELKEDSGRIQLLAAPAESGCNAGRTLPGVFARARGGNRHERAFVLGSL